MSKTLKQFRELREKIGQKKYEPAYLLHGEETFFTDEICDQLTASVLPEAERSFNQFTFYGKDSNPAEIIATCKRFPMMSDKLLVIVKEAQQLKKPEVELFIPYLQQPQPSTTLVFYHRGKKLPANTKLFKAFNKYEVLTSDSLYDRDTQQWIREHFARHQFKVEDAAIEMLFEYLGNNLDKINNAMQQLMINHKDDKHISLSMVQESIGIDRDYNVFELQKALGLKQSQKAVKIALGMSRNIKSNPFMLVLGSLNSYYGRLLAFKVSNGKAIQGNPYMIRELEQAAGKYRSQDIEKVFDILREYDLRFKGVDTIGMSEEDLLTEMTLKLSTPVST